MAPKKLQSNYKKTENYKYKYMAFKKLSILLIVDIE